MSTPLLDANGLIAWGDLDHEHHARLVHWLTDVPVVALCPITEGAWIRYAVRSGPLLSEAQELLRGLYDSGRATFWGDHLSYGDADLGRILGHKQVTDHYLAALAAAHDGYVATLDEPFATRHPQATLIPVLR